jgi:hypothetical protein
MTFDQLAMLALVWSVAMILCVIAAAIYVATL